MNEQTNVKKVAELAMLELSPQEVSSLQQKIDQIRQYFDTIANLTSEPKSERQDSLPSELIRIYREDVCNDDQFDRSVQFSPYTESGGFTVPKVIE